MKIPRFLFFGKNRQGETVVGPQIASEHGVNSYIESKAFGEHVQLLQPVSEIFIVQYEDRPFQSSPIRGWTWDPTTGLLIEVPLPADMPVEHTGIMDAIQKSRAETKNVISRVEGLFYIYTRGRYIKQVNLGEHTDFPASLAGLETVNYK